MQDPGSPHIGAWTRRGVIGSMAVGGLAFVVFGPSGAREAPRDRVVLRYWEKWTGQEGQAMRRIVDAFNASQDRIYVQYFSMSAIDQKAMISIAGDDPPDLLGLWSDSIPGFSGADALMPLDALIANHGADVERAFAERYGDADGFVLNRERYLKPVWNLHAPAALGGTMWGVVNTCNTLGLVYDRNAVREAGMDPDAPPRTISEFDEFTDRLTVTDSDGDLVRAGFVHREPGWWNFIWGYGFGGSLFDPAGTTPESAITAATPENIAGFEWLQSYPRKFGVGRLASFSTGFGNYNSAQQPLLAGKVASALHGSFLANVIQTFDPSFELGAAPFPVADRIYDPDRPIGMIEADVLTIPRGCKHPAEAFEFLCFTQRQQAIESLAIAHAKPTSLVDVSPDFESRHPNPRIDVFNKVAGSARAFQKPVTTVWAQYADEFNAQMDTFWNNAEPAAEVLATMQRRMERQLAAAWARRARREGQS